MLKIKVYKDARGEYRWRAIDSNGRIIADGSEGYETEQGIVKAIRNVMEEFNNVAVFFDSANKKYSI